MKILFLTHEYPFPLHAGDTILTWNTLRYLVDRHQVHLVAYEPRSTERGDDLRARLWQSTLVPRPPAGWRRIRQAASLLSSRSSIEFVGRNRHYAQAVVRAFRDTYDVVIVDHLRMAWVLSEMPRLPPATRLVLRSHNCESDVRRLYVRFASGTLLAYFLAIEEAKIRTFEERAIRTADAVIAISAPDAACHALQGAGRTFVAPAGCDFGPPGAFVDPRGQEPGTLVLMGSFDYWAKELNALFLIRDVLPLVRDQVPGASLLLVGKGPSRRLERIARATPGVTLTGRVPDARSVACRGQVFVMPTVVGGGLELKGLEAVAMGLPIVATPLAARGLELSYGSSIRIGHDASELAREIVALLGDEDARRRQAASAYREAAAKYGWASVGLLFESALRAIVGSKGAGQI